MHMTATKKLLIIGTVWPEPNSSAAGSRMMQLIDLFLAAHWQITFASTASKSNWSVDLQNLGVESVSIAINHSSFDELIKQGQFEAVVFDRFTTEEKFAWRIAELLPNALRILDTEDLHFLRTLRTQQWKNNTQDEAINWQDKACFREMASIYRSDCSLIISRAEMKLLLDTFGVKPSRLCYLPLLYTKPNFEAFRKFEERKDLLFIGNFLHEPNMQSVLELKEKIWPQLRKDLPGVQLHIYGAYPSQKALALHNPKENFLVHGRAENVQDIMQSSRLLLAPIPFGAGLKGKLLEAMTYGLPSVTSAIGAEGIGNDETWPGAIAKTDANFIAASKELYLNESEWKNAQLKGLNCIETHFLFTDFKPIFLQTLDDLIENIETNRTQNFMESLVQFHSFQNNKYFSKWIEEKNK